MNYLNHPLKRVNKILKEQKKNNILKNKKISENLIKKNNIDSSFTLKKGYLSEKSNNSPNKDDNFEIKTNNLSYKIVDKNIDLIANMNKNDLIIPFNESSNQNLIKYSFFELSQNNNINKKNINITNNNNNVNDKKYNNNDKKNNENSSNESDINNNKKNIDNVNNLNIKRFNNIDEKIKFYNLNLKMNNNTINNNKFNEIKFEDLKFKLIEFTKNKKGLEIGGPSQRTGKMIYDNNIELDNTIINENIKIEKYTMKNFYKNIYINDNTNLHSIKNEKYDFIFSSNCLEHIANPLKAINESLRVLKNKGFLIIIVPDKKYTFDHYRNYSEFKEIKDAYDKDIKEDDISRIDEILKNHDLSRDRINTKFDIFKEKCLNNYETRIIHHYVYNFNLLKEIVIFLDEYIEEVYQCKNNVDLWFIIKKK